MSKLCINEVIPYVQKSDWGKGKDGRVYNFMKNIVIDNDEHIKKVLGQYSHLEEYINSNENESNNVETNIKEGREYNKTEGQENTERENKENENKENEDKERENIEDKQNEVNQEKIKEKGKGNNEMKGNYAELWIGRHKNSPNLVMYNNTLIGMDEFLKIYEGKMKKRKKGFIKYVMQKIKTGKKKYLKQKSDTSSKNSEEDIKEKKEDENNFNYSLKSTLTSENKKLFIDNDEKNSPLPFIFKILSIAKPLSIQMHPNQKQALYLNALDSTVYRDKILKTEMCLCLNSMALLCGTMNVFKIAFLIVHIPELFQLFLKQEETNNDIRIDRYRSGSNGKERKIKNKESIDKDKDKDENRDKNRDKDKEKRKSHSMDSIEKKIDEEEKDTINMETKYSNVPYQKKEQHKKEQYKKEHQTKKKHLLFSFFDFFSSEKDVHIKDILVMLSRIYEYTINYILKDDNRFSGLGIIEMIDIYAEHIQKYIFDKQFFQGFYKNENFLQNKYCLNYLIRKGKEHWKGFCKRRKSVTSVLRTKSEEMARKNTNAISNEYLYKCDIFGSSEEEEEEEEEDEEDEEEQNKQKKNKEMEEVCKREISTLKKKEETVNGENLKENCINVNELGDTNDTTPVTEHRLDRLSSVDEEYFDEFKKIKSFYKYMYTYYIQKVILSDDNVINEYIHSIMTKNEMYLSFLHIKDHLNNIINKLNEDFMLHKCDTPLEKIKEILLFEKFQLLKDVSQYYENDAGRVYVFLLKFMKLNHRDAIYIKPGVIHAYLWGDCLECMTNSDLVLRCGLTGKLQDKANFLKCVSYQNNNVIRIEKEFINYNVILYRYKKLNLFSLFLISVKPGEKMDFIFSNKCFTSCIVMSSNKKVQLEVMERHKKKKKVKYVKSGTIFLIAPKFVVVITNNYIEEEDGDKEFLMYCATAKTVV